MPTLNDRHFAALRFIRDFYRERHYSPNMREIGRAIGVDSTSLIQFYLAGLEDAGLITRAPKIARSIVLTKAGEGEFTGAIEKVR